MNQEHTDLVDVLQTSERWIEQFNRGNVESCAAAYVAKATMKAHPIGTFSGRAAIYNFWQPFVESGAGDLVYENTRLTHLGEDRVQLKASWRMNVARGVIENEVWVRGRDGVWRLEEDEFAIEEQFDA